jgi:photosynthetic reaction center cytochrome c subunit
MADFKWFSKWNRDNPTNIFGPAYVVGAIGGAVVVAALVVTWGYPANTSSVQTGPRGTGMEVIKFASDRAAPDPDAAAFYTQPAIVPAAGEALASDAYANAEPLLGDLTVGNYDRLVEAMRIWTGIPGLFDGEETYQTVVARQMIQMTQSINETWGDHVAPAGVTCYTCHRGEPVPSNIWFDISPVVESFEGWSGNQNRVTALSQSTSLPSDALQKFLVDYEPIRVHDLEPRVDNAGTASVQDAERTFSLMNYFSNSLGTNCTYCHNTRALHDIDQATPQLAQAQLGIGMALDVNNQYLLPLSEVLPPNRLGALHGDAPKVGCATCHKGQLKPLNGLTVIADWPELGASGPPVYE